MLSLKKTALTLALACACCAQALAAYPEKEAKIVIPYKPGGATDIIYRVTSSGAEPSFGQSIVPVNQSGAGGVKGARFVKDAPADGYTLLAGHDFLHTTYYGNLSKFSIEAFEPVCLLTQTPNILTIRPGLPFKDFKGMCEYAKANPGKVAISYSPASTGTLFFAELFKRAGVDAKLFRVVTINGTGPQVTNLLGGHVDAVMGNVPSVLEYAKEGKLIMLGVSADKRLDACPDVPTFKEMGIDFSYANNRGVFAPKGTDKAVVNKIAASYKASLDNPEVSKRIFGLGSIPAYMGPAEYKAFLEGQDALYKANFKK
ncbi:MAG: tripartite tricarboxylate transporter substrate binding protein [Duodenibacillus sp.]|nr:tripartite tricarboxylate transporter substrate binding protein [Duodenibacillus sp.]